LKSSIDVFDDPLTRDKTTKKRIKQKDEIQKSSMKERAQRGKNVLVAASYSSLVAGGFVRV
jgi:hypothetical protein